MEEIAVETVLEAGQRSQAIKDMSPQGPDIVFDVDPPPFDISDIEHTNFISVPWSSLSAAPEADPVIYDQAEETCPASPTTGRDGQNHSITIQSEASEDPPDAHETSGQSGMDPSTSESLPAMSSKPSITQNIPPQPESFRARILSPLERDDLPIY